MGRGGSPAKNAGVYHIASGKWTRQVGSTASLGPDTIYSNTPDSSYFGDLLTSAATGDFSVLDEGQLSGTSSSVVLADRDEYYVNGMTFGYCTDRPGPTVGLTFH